MKIDNFRRRLNAFLIWRQRLIQPRVVGAPFGQTQIILTFGLDKGAAPSILERLV